MNRIEEVECENIKIETKHILKKLQPIYLNFISLIQPSIVSSSFVF